jgi:pimeloyl-ACP methyl ester carboxylesterase
MGGYVALTMALERPDAVRSLVLAGTGAGGPDRVRRPAPIAAAFTAALRLPYDEFARRTMPYAFAPGWTDANPERFEEILDARLEHPSSFETVEAHARACYAFYDAGCEVERIEARALVVHGTEDAIVPVENGRRLAARLPNAEYVELEGGGHDLPLEVPEVFAEHVLGFLGR